ncbi:MAG: chemotaxis protein CheR [Geobacter sp.]|nr:MAG: chemotaxis protein CheR [Geobacter sp.]
MTTNALRSPATPRLSSGDFTRLSRFIYDECGIRMPPSKKTMLEARLNRRLRELGMRSFTDYCTHLFGNSGVEERVTMIDLATTNKTDFFREADHFSYLTQQALPEWRQRRGGGGSRRLMVWSAGCSTGEEPYTLAMVLQEFAAGCGDFDFRILATDISTQVLGKAQLAVYHEDRVAPVPLYLKRKYLLRSKDRENGLVRVVPELRAKVSFRRLNFMAGDFGLRETMDIIFCRNVIIYFDRPTQERLLNRLCAHLHPGGLIFMGHSETLSGLDVPLTQVSPTVYRKVS